MSTTDLSVTPIADKLLACFDDEISKVPAPPRTVSLRIGTQVELLIALGRDECCEGVAWVRVVSIFPSANFPEPDITYSRCGPVQWAATFELGAARCAPVSAENTIPSGETWTAVAHAVQDDAAAMRRALCCFADQTSKVMYLPGQWTSLPVEGGCAGGVMTVTIAIGDCDC